MFFLGSAYPMGKLGLNADTNPILLGALRMGIVFLCLIPFSNFKVPPKKARGIEPIKNGINNLKLWFPARM